MSKRMSQAEFEKALIDEMGWTPERVAEIKAKVAAARKARRNRPTLAEALLRAKEDDNG